MTPNSMPQMMADPAPQVAPYDMIAYLAEQVATRERVRAQERAMLEQQIERQQAEIDALKTAQQPATVEGAAPAPGEGGGGDD